jgi:hypothetical protein
MSGTKLELCPLTLCISLRSLGGNKKKNDLPKSGILAQVPRLAGRGEVNDDFVHQIING